MAQPQPRTRKMAKNKSIFVARAKKVRRTTVRPHFRCTAFSAVVVRNLRPAARVPVITVQSMKASDPSSVCYSASEQENPQQDHFDDNFIIFEADDDESDSEFDSKTDDDDFDTESEITESNATGQDACQYDLSDDAFIVFEADDEDSGSGCDSDSDDEGSSLDSDSDTESEYSDGGSTDNDEEKDHTLTSISSFDSVEVPHSTKYKQAGQPHSNTNLPKHFDKSSTSSSSRVSSYSRGRCPEISEEPQPRRRLSSPLPSARRRCAPNASIYVITLDDGAYLVTNTETDKEVGLFADREDADDAVTKLEAGFIQGPRGNWITAGVANDNGAKMGMGEEDGAIPPVPKIPEWALAFGWVARIP
ncbi:hypothetical protein M501DRAFT_994332 [Patellaria atrata CBS 101060]|uniref:Uncharacterized protein n=1 Tax=Patellaria atrata CBS 101060 TaxID=1346257 RepID=A0A9P4SIQ6_9PEZI|nr:hypothetical protein M501DRAFT_994332 [Patellaria atrata CBS 101060]